MYKKVTDMPSPFFYALLEKLDMYAENQSLFE
jgi:hypothetical protein